ncbi:MULTISPECIES: hypothetical protein [unclassified Tolypothrix]|uniref:hypothetical protein n=1 Tax=unclassified Tolypothrix TaxID=2649714 RepID=UPI0005EAB48F|nr:MULTISPECIES: hypothetical protein [unclassified Tolypothrix]EKF04973.1 toxin-antitoxin system, antitoxin component, Xre domain protein [Tolypothrix sp. PCC 7601]MBE9081273.1 hypothetical protein [Tolypothrix sp. LEGE 11397]UYD31890.1 hypothetical protein HG267_22690 [Tolypothrix sp. PCC 7601]
MRTPATSPIGDATPSLLPHRGRSCDAIAIGTDSSEQRKFESKNKLSQRVSADL